MTVFGGRLFWGGAFFRFNYSELSRAIDFRNLLALRNTSALGYRIDWTQDRNFKITSAIKQPVAKLCSLFRFKMVLEQLFCSFRTLFCRLTLNICNSAFCEICGRVMPFPRTRPEVCCNLQYYAVLVSFCGLVRGKSHWSTNVIYMRQFDDATHSTWGFLLKDLTSPTLLAINKYLPLLSSSSIGCFRAVISLNMSRYNAVTSFSFRMGATCIIIHIGVSGRNEASQLYDVLGEDHICSTQTTTSSL